MKKVLTSLVALILIIGCIGPKNISSAESENMNFHAKMVNLVVKTERSYEQILTSAGRIHEQGLITDERLAEIEDIGNKVYQGITRAKRALKVFIESGGSQTPVVSAVAALIDAMTGLLLEYGMDTNLVATTTMDRHELLRGYATIGSCTYF
jgi:hypothetical protein|tara:strand:+ start:679 stop:1134 length:456 start_codon:yes stop_codon:yes gene_type:complete